jgi:TonB family protein
VLNDVRLHWYNYIPESARPPVSRKSEVAIEFEIAKDGKVSKMKIAQPSGDPSLDIAAWNGVAAANPFQPLPTKFSGSFLVFRLRFTYNLPSTSSQPSSTPANVDSSNPK